jgi:two-component system osmolarity sensor histidine kinase EnvZ
VLRRLAGSLLFRLIVLVVVVVVTTQVVTVYIAAGERHKLMDKQLYAQVVDTLAFLEGSMDNMNPAQRTAFLASYNRPGLPRLFRRRRPPPTVRQGTATRGRQPGQPPEQGSGRHRARLHGAPRRPQRAVGERACAGHPLLAGDSFGRYSDRPIYSLIQAALLATVLAILLASLVAWRITRPISKVVDASRELARGKLPSPLPKTARAS